MASKVAERYHECIRALEKCTNATVCRFEFEMKRDGSAAIIVTANSHENEMQMAKLALTILGAMYRPQPTGEIIEREDEQEPEDA